LLLLGALLVIFGLFHKLFFSPKIEPQFQPYHISNKIDGILISNGLFFLIIGLIGYFAQ
jgi:hypothetical protein